MNKEQHVYLNDILEYIDRIEQVMDDGGKEKFDASFMHQDAMIRNFEVIGEIIKRLDSSITDSKPHIRWSAYAGFRDVLIHQYNKVVLEIVWQTAHDDLPILKTAITELLSQNNDAGEENPPS